MLRDRAEEIITEENATKQEAMAQAKPEGFYVENRTPTMRRKARGIFIERKEITQGVKDYYDYKADCKNLWFFCEKDDDEDFLALVIHGLSDHLDSRYPASVHSNFKQRRV